MKTLDPTKPYRGALKRLVLAVAVASGLVAGSALANSLVWNLASGGNWDIATTPNWNLPDTTPTTFANGDEVTFNNTAGGTINIASGVMPLSTTVSAASGTYTFSGGSIASGPLTKGGNGTLTITSVNNTFAGGTIINGGRLRLDLDVLSLGTGSITLNAGEIFLWRARPTNPLIVNGGKVIAENGFSNNRFDGPITLNATLTCDVFFKLTCSQAISGTGGLTKTQGGPMILSVANSYSGPTTVTGGTLQCDNVDALGGGGLSISSTGSAKVDLNFTGTKSVASLTLGGTSQTVAGTYGSLTSAASFKSAYFSGTGMVQVGDPAYAANMLSFGTNVPGSAAVIDPIVANAAAITWYVPNGTNLATLAPDFVMSAGSTCSDQTSGVVPVPGFNAGPVTYTVVSQNTLTTNVYTVTATELPAESTLIWNLASGGAWNLTSPNWRGQSSGFPTPYFDGFNVIFDNTAGGTITLDGNLSPLSTTVNAASGTYTLSVVSGGGAITTGSLTKHGGGTLLMAKANSYAGGTTITNGTLKLEWPGDGVSHTTLGSGPVILDGGTLWLNRVDLANDLTVNGGSLTLDNGFGSTWTGAVTLNASNLNITAYYANHPFTGPISGSGGFTLSSVAGGGLALSGTNDYTGPTIVTSGTLQCNNVNALGGGALSISGGKANLNYVGSKTVSSLTLGGVAKTVSGTYGSIASGATFQDDTYFTTGSLGTVTVGGSGFTTWAAANAGGQTAGEDFDNDGVDNGIEYFMGQTGSSFTANPSLNASNAISWPASAAYQGTYEVQTSPDLVNWTNVVPKPVPSGGTLSYTLPTGAPGGKSFVRLFVTPTP